jgi:hypothetical protein
MNACCVESVPQPESCFETVTGPVADSKARVTAGSACCMQANDQTLGHLEEKMLHQTWR